mmetsp:Transcript_74341/g.191797  ORF Transcript_74341/g.191797 Transcript_74341/m.191797 type:complete len:230 (+) Transcript_74341:1882-2571(+)
MPLQQRRHHNDSRQDDGRDVVGLLALFHLGLRLVHGACGGAVVHEPYSGLCGGLAGEEDDERHLGNDARPQQDVEDATEGLLQQLQPLVLLLRRRDLVFAVDLAIDPRLLLLEACRAAPALQVAGELGLEDRRQPVQLQRVHQRLVVLLLIKCIRGLEPLVPLPDLLRLNEDGAGVGHHALRPRHHRSSAAQGSALVEKRPGRHGSANATTPTAGRTQEGLSGHPRGLG